MNEKDFLKQITELAEFAKAKDNKITKKEIKEYCEDMKLSDEQLTLVYDYLVENRIEVVGYKKSTEKLMEENEDKDVSEDSKYIRVYRKELKAIKDYKGDDLDDLYKRLQAGEDEAVVNEAIEVHLKRVVTLAGKYRGRGVPLEDLIQEGNLELITCISMLYGNKDVDNHKKTIDHSIRSKMVELVDSELRSDDSVNSLLGRVNLLLEATHTLAEEFGRLATIEELSEFTKMSISEIEDYIEVSNDGIEVGTTKE